MNFSHLYSSALDGVVAFNLRLTTDDLPWLLRPLESLSVRASGL